MVWYACVIPLVMDFVAWISASATEAGANDDTAVQACFENASRWVAETSGLELPADLGMRLCSIDVEAARGYAFVVLVAVITVSVTPQLAGGIGIT